MLRVNTLVLSLLSMSYMNTTAAEQQHLSSYIGQEKRVIKSLSEDDIKQLRAGKGWGLAKAAELNGVPGPAHILQMKEKISLSKEQEIKIRDLFEDMRLKAIPLGRELVELERKLNNSFADNSITSELLNQQLNTITTVRKKLRYAHLVTHLMTPSILSFNQIKKYNQLRGYGTGDPCKKLPKGHDVEMWSKHNGCK